MEFIMWHTLFECNFFCFLCFSLLLHAESTMHMQIVFQNEHVDLWGSPPHGCSLMGAFIKFIAMNIASLNIYFTK